MQRCSFSRVASGSEAGSRALVLFVLLGLLACLGACAEAPPPEVAVKVVFTPVKQQAVTLYGEFVGRTRASKRVEVNARINGFLEDIAFTEGSVVEKAALLYRIDDRPYRAKVDRVEATLTSRRAVLEKARRDGARIKPLFEENAASQLDYDDAVSAVEQAQASVREVEADLENALLDLEYTELRATIGGLIGESRVDVGSLIQANDSTPLTTVSQIDPIHVYFSMSALDYLNARRRTSLAGEARAEREGKALEGLVRITLPDGSQYGERGVVGFTDPQVNPQTGTFAIRAVVPNPRKELLPGQYTRVRLPLEYRSNVLLIPEQSIVIEQGGVYVYVVLSDDRVERRLIFLGPAVEGQLIVDKGLQVDERIIVEGVNKVYHGTLVAPVSEAEYQLELERNAQEQLAPSGSEANG